MFSGWSVWNPATTCFAKTSFWKRRILWLWERAELEKYQGYGYVYTGLPFCVDIILLSPHCWWCQVHPPSCFSVFKQNASNAYYHGFFKSSSLLGSAFCICFPETRQNVELSFMWFSEGLVFLFLVFPVAGIVMSVNAVFCFFLFFFLLLCYVIHYILVLCTLYRLLLYILF